MNGEEARLTLAAELKRYREWPWKELMRLLDEQVVGEVAGPSGALYQIEFQVCWDDREGGPLRVIASIDDGGWRAFCPITDSFIMRPDGSFVDE